MQDHLEPFRDEIEDFVKHKYEIVEQTALLWKLIHYMILKYQRNHPEWMYVRYEDIALRPVGSFGEIFENLKVPFHRRIRRVLEYQELGIVQSERAGGDNNSAGANTNVDKWNAFLTADEVNKIRSRVEEVSSEFISDEEWAS
jgi:hypothetical protein